MIQNYAITGQLENYLNQFLLHNQYFHMFSWKTYKVGRVFARDPGDRRSVPGGSHTKVSKMVLATSLLNTQHYKVRTKGKVGQLRERSGAPPLHLNAVAI